MISIFHLTSILRHTPTKLDISYIHTQTYSDILRHIYLDSYTYHAYVLRHIYLDSQTYHAYVLRHINLNS